MRLKLLFLFLISLSGLLLMEGCALFAGDGINCGDGPKTSSFLISESDKNKIPFSGSDTLTFKGTNGELAVLYAQGKLNKASCEDANYGGDPGCPEDQNCFETISFSYTGDNSHLNRIFIKYIASKYAPSQSNFDLSIGNHSVDDISLGYLNSSTNYSDTVVIDSIVYLGRKINIYEDVNNNNSFVYNHKYGILKITTSNVEWFKKM